MKLFPLIGTLTIALLVACKKSPEPNKASSGNGNSWGTSFMSAALPDGWRGREASDASGSKIVAIGPEEQETFMGIPAGDPLLIMRYEKAKSNKTLIEIVQENEARWRKNEGSPGRFIGRAQTVRLGKGKCVAYRLEYRRGNCENFNPRTKERNACFQRMMNAVCEDRAGAYYEITSDLGQYVEAGKPPKDIIDLERTVEQILSSIKFTQG